MKKYLRVFWIFLFFTMNVSYAGFGTGGNIETGVYGGYDFLDDYITLQPENGWLVGARLGYWFTDHTSLEGDYHHVFSKSAGKNFGFESARVNVLYHLFAGRTVRPFVTAGVGWDGTGVDLIPTQSLKDKNDIGFNAGLGSYVFLTPSLALRIEGRYHTIDFNDFDSHQQQNNFEVMLGLSKLWRNKKEVTPVKAPVVTTLQPKSETIVVKDTDGDGVKDELDQCPNTSKGATVNSVGCEVDSDQDGVFDSKDKCANTPLGTKVDISGCPEAVTKKAKGILNSVTFDTGKSTLRSSSFAALDEVVKALKETSDVTVEVQGHTDSTGNKDKNLELSGQRALSVVNYLISKGVPAARLTSKGYGSSVPVANNKTAAGRSQNRRVELKWLD